MAIVRSFGAVENVSGRTPWVSASGGSMNLYGASAQTYAAIYRAQPNVRTVVDFLARNIAQLGLHAFRRVSDTDRERLADHELVRWVGKPNPSTTRFRLFESLMGDLGVYFNAYWLKVRVPNRIGLLRLPPEQMNVEGGLLPSLFVWTNEDGTKKEFAPSEIVHFNGFDPLNPLMGFSPLETLRRILAEEASAGEYRESLWAHAGRFEGVVERPATAPRWTPTQKTDWRTQWQAQFGAGGTRPGSIAVLEDGMMLKQASFSAKESEYFNSRKLTREECAAAYHVPLPMVGILEHATFSNIREQHKHLYQDSLGPWLTMIVDELDRQLLVECEDQRDVYLEFNIAEKLKGSFEEQASSLQALVGRPIMTANEGRARLNLPRDSDPASDKLALQQGGPAANDPTKQGARQLPPAPDAEPDDEARAQVIDIIGSTRVRQHARLAKHDVTERPDVFRADVHRWNRELADDLIPLVGAAAHDYAVIANAQMLARLKAEAENA